MMDELVRLRSELSGAEHGVDVAKSRVTDAEQQRDQARIALVNALIGAGAGVVYVYSSDEPGALPEGYYVIDPGPGGDVASTHRLARVNSQSRAESWTGDDGAEVEYEEDEDWRFIYAPHLDGTEMGNAAFSRSRRAQQARWKRLHHGA